MIKWGCFWGIVSGVINLLVEVLFVYPEIHDASLVKAIYAGIFGTIFGSLTGFFLGFLDQILVSSIGRWVVGGIAGAVFGISICPSWMIILNFKGPVFYYNLDFFGGIIGAMIGAYLLGHYGKSLVRQKPEKVQT